MKTSLTLTHHSLSTTTKSYGALSFRRRLSAHKCHAREQGQQQFPREKGGEAMSLEESDNPPSPDRLSQIH